MGKYVIFIVVFYKTKCMMQFSFVVIQTEKMLCVILIKENGVIGLLKVKSKRNH